jgi:hypothetical protein
VAAGRRKEKENNIKLRYGRGGKEKEKKTLRMGRLEAV